MTSWISRLDLMDYLYRYNSSTWTGEPRILRKKRGVLNDAPAERWKPLRSNRQVVIERDGHVCRYCGTDVRGRLTLDHVVPKSRGGTNSVGNMVVCCSGCNQFKGDKILDEAAMRLHARGNFY